MLDRTICKFSLLSVILAVSACMPSQQDRPVEIRIVDLNGNPSNVKKFVPEGNIQAMAAQSANPFMAQTPMIETQTAQPAVQQLPSVASEPQVNNLANITNSVVGTEAAKEPETTISYDMSSDVPQKAPAASGVPVTESQPVATSSGAKKFKFVTAAGAEKQAKTKATKSSAKVSSGSKAVSGKFIQIGSFTSEEKANEILNDSGKISSGTIEEVKVGGKVTYRVLLGPVEGGSAKTQQVLSKVKQSGYKDAFIVK